MSFSIGIVGLPNVGKSTLFKALTKKPVEIANYPFCTIEPNVGIVEVPDARLEKIFAVAKSEKMIPTVVEFVDIAGLVKGANQGEGLGNQFLANIREVDAIVHLVRNFTDPDVAHPTGEINPQSDIEIVNTELLLKDLETVTRHFSDLKGKTKAGGSKEELKKIEVLEKIKRGLEEGKLVVRLNLISEEEELIKDLNLLTSKPIIYVVNVDESEIRNHSPRLGEAGKSEIPNINSKSIITISAKIEAELADLTKEEKDEYLKELGLEESGLDKLIKKSYQLLDLITFFTQNPKECHAWTVRRGAKAPQAAGRIHTDFEAGFIKAEVCPWEKFVEHSEAGCKAKGLMHLEGKDYVVQDGDVIYFKFNK